MRRFHLGILQYKDKEQERLLDFFSSLANDYSFVSFKSHESAIYPWFFPTFTSKSYVSFLPREAVFFGDDCYNWPSKNKNWKSMVYHEDADTVTFKFFDDISTIAIYANFPYFLYKFCLFFPKLRMKLINLFVKRVENLDYIQPMFSVSLNKEEFYEIQN